MRHALVHALKALVVAGAATLVGCGGSATSGSGAATPATTTPAQGGAGTPSTTTEPPLFELTSHQLCELLTPAEAVRLGGSAKGRPTAGFSTGHPLCQWTKHLSLNIDYGKDTRSSQAPTGRGITNTPTRVAGHTAVLSRGTRFRSRPDFCQVIVDVTRTSTMAFGAGLHDSGRGRYEPCDVARRLAGIVVPKVEGRLVG